MRTRITAPDQMLSLIDRVHPKYKPVWDCCPLCDRIALALYFLPHNSLKDFLCPTRPHMIKWYDPFASQRDFPSGHRYCINVYTGCSHKCVYCYASSYGPEKAVEKKGFRKRLDKDMGDLECFNVPPAPVHLSISTDPFQPLEAELGHTKYALEKILAYRQRFTTVTVLTKNPVMAIKGDYIDLFKALTELPTDHPKHKRLIQNGAPGFVIEVSLAFWQEEARAVYDPNAPTVQSRIEGIQALHRADIPLVLRIDPLFPRSPITERPLQTLADFGLPEAQTLSDLESLVTLAKNVEVRHVVYSAAKIIRPRFQPFSETMQRLHNVYETLALPKKPEWRGGSWRLPSDIAETNVVRPFLEICERKTVHVRHCMRNLIESP
jgi:DNA repair photolyase